MDEDQEIIDQDDQNQNNGDNHQSNDNGGAGDDTQKVKIGDEEYTPEQLTDIVKKGKSYDELLPDYTKKSQKLSEIEKNLKGSETKEEKDVPIYRREGWKPKTVEEIVEAIKQAEENGEKKTLATLEAQRTQMEERTKALDDFYGEVMKSDKDFDEADFSNFVLEHTKEKEDVSLADIKSFYSVYKELDHAVALGEENARKNKENRNEKVNGGEGGEGNQNVDFTDIRTHGGDMRDKAFEALERLKK